MGGFKCHIIGTVSYLSDPSPEDAYSKLVEVVADVSDEDHVGNSLLQIWKLRFTMSTP